MPSITLTFRFLDAANQPVNSSAADLAVINTLGLNTVNQPDAQSITGQRNVNAPVATCAKWNNIFDRLNAPFNIFSDALGTVPVTKVGACIGSIIVGAAVTLYLKPKPAPAAVAPAVAAAAAAPAVAALVNGAAITAYLTNAALTHIRVYIPNSISRGHQTTTCLVIRRLIAMGYRGAFEVIYINQNGNATTIKILLPELQLVVAGEDITGGPYQNAALGNCSFSFIIKGAAPAAQRALGISGGVDNPDDDPKVFCNVLYFLMLQPFQWNAANYLYAQNTLFDLGDQVLLNRLRFVGTSCYYLDIAGYAWAAAPPEINQIADAQARAAVTAINTYCCAAASTKFLLPVYGLHATLANQWVLTNWVGSNLKQIKALANIVLATLMGQAAAPLNQGTVIMTLDTYAPGMLANLLTLLPAPYHARISFWAPGGAAWNDAMITGLGANQILIINFPGILPAPLFNYFYLNSSLPPIFEGKGTMPVMLNSGRPYLQISKNQNGLDTINAVSAAAVVRMLKVFLFPELPYQVATSAGGTIETTVQNGVPLACLAAGNAIVWNSPAAAVVINAQTFGVSGVIFNLIKTYLTDKFYINAGGQVQNKFMALLAAADFEDDGFPTAVITKQTMYTAMQTACGAGAANICTVYRANIALLSAYFGNAVTPASPLVAYFTALGAHFHNPANDKLTEGLSFAVAAINANL